MILTKKQEEGLKIAVNRYNEGYPYTCIAGYAGSGKSTLVRFIIDALGIDNEYVAYIAYTGKAAKVLKEKGCPNATTAHRLLYHSYPRKDGTFYHIPARPLDRRYKLIVIDEVSMLPKEMWDLLLSHHIYVIALGDPGQLPPVSSEDNEVLKTPHIFLDEIMRQAQESEIVRLSMDIRNGKDLTPFKGKELMILNRKDLDPSMYIWADTVLVGKNDTRHAINSTMRRMIYGVDNDEPVDGDKIICLRNDWHTVNSAGDALVNGGTGFIQNPIVVPSKSKIVKWVIKADFILDEDSAIPFVNLDMDYKMFTEGEPTVNSDNFKKVSKQLTPKQFDYGYCITTHKSQGSEYNKVLLLEEYLRGDDHARWLYTAITRAKEKLVIIKS